MDIKEIEERIVSFARKRASAKNFDLTPELSFIHLITRLSEVFAKQKFWDFSQENPR